MHGATNPSMQPGIELKERSIAIGQEIEELAMMSCWIANSDRVQ